MELPDSHLSMEIVFNKTVGKVWQSNFPCSLPDHSDTLRLLVISLSEQSARKDVVSKDRPSVPSLAKIRMPAGVIPSGPIISYAPKHVNVVLHAPRNPTAVL